MGWYTGTGYLNEEFLVSTGQQAVLIKSLPFVHTARRYYRLGGLVRERERDGGGEIFPCFLNADELDLLEEVKVVTRFP